MTTYLLTLILAGVIGYLIFRACFERGEEQAALAQLDHPHPEDTITPNNTRTMWGD